MRFIIVLAMLTSVVSYGQSVVKRTPVQEKINSEIIGGSISLAGGSALIGVAALAFKVDPDTRRLGVSPIGICTGVIGGALIGTGIGYISHAVTLRKKHQIHTF